MLRTGTLTLFLAILATSLSAQSKIKEQAAAGITEEVIAGPLEFLASDWTQGRETGTEGAYMASDYIASMFKTLGLKPGGDPIRIRGSRKGAAPVQNPEKVGARSYFQNFQLLEYRSGDRQEFSIISAENGGFTETKLNQNGDFTLTAGPRAIDVKSEVVFVGYGFKAEGYNDFANVNVKNKIIIRLAGFPGHQNPSSKAYQKFAPEDPYGAYFIARNKDASALEAGAAAVIDIQIHRPSYTPTPQNFPFRFNEAKYEGTEPFRTEPETHLIPPNSNSEITKLQLSESGLEMLLSGLDLEFNEFEENAERKMKPASRAFPDRIVHLATSVITRIIQVRNVIGMIEGRQADTCIVLGAHYDHTGQIRNFIYNGSDDNASGTTGIMTIAKAFMETGVKPEYTVVFCAWTGEEKGLIGSAYYAAHPLITNMKCYMNYDMISRIAPDDPNKNKCDFQFTSTAPILKELTEKHIRDYQINLDISYKGSEKPTGGSDFSSFSKIGVPIFLLHGKFTSDYHQHTDHSDKADLTYMRDIIRLGFLNIFELSTKSW